MWGLDSPGMSGATCSSVRARSRTPRTLDARRCASRKPVCATSRQPTFRGTLQPSFLTHSRTIPPRHVFLVARASISIAVHSSRRSPRSGTITPALSPTTPHSALPPAHTPPRDQHRTLRRRPRGRAGAGPLRGRTTRTRGRARARRATPPPPPMKSARALDAADVRRGGEGELPATTDLVRSDRVREPSPREPPQPKQPPPPRTQWYGW